MTTNLLILLGCLLASAFFSGVEIAFISANKLRFEIDKKRSALFSKIINFFIHKPSELITTMLIGTNIAIVIFGLVATRLLSPFLPPENFYFFIIQTIITTLIILFAGEFLPKSLFRISPNFLIYYLIVPIFFFYVLFFPITQLCNLLTFGIMKLFRKNEAIKANKRIITKIDLSDYITQKEPTNDEEEQNIQMFKNALDFSKVKLRDCMVPRTEIFAIEDTEIETELKKGFEATGYSKALIYKDSIDNIIGYIHSSILYKDIKNINEAIIAPIIVPEVMPAHKLLSMFLKQRKSVAVVVDEFGGTAGIVTVEDILEEIFGEIQDEHDSNEFVEKKINDKEYVFSARLEIDYLNNIYDLDLPESDDYSTLAGMILFINEDFPKVNDIIIADKYTFKIIKATEKAISLVNIKVND